MKAYMKLAAGLLVVSIPAMGQLKPQESQKKAAFFDPITSHSEAYVEKAVGMYTQLLSSTNDGVVESALAHLAFCRMGVQKDNLENARSAIVDLAESGRTLAIRYKAHLAAMVFETPELFRDGLTTGSGNSDQFFFEIDSRVQKSLLGQNLK